LQQSRANSPFVIPCYARNALPHARDRGHGLNDGDVGPYEFERDDFLLQLGVLEDPLEDHFVLLEELRIPNEKLPPNIRECSDGGEVLGVARCVAFVPGLDLVVDDVAKGGFIG